MQNKQELTTQQLIEEAVKEFDEYNAEKGGPLYPNRNSEWLKTKLTTIATKSAEVERERILGLASDISDELTNANVPVIHPGELGEHEPDDVWEVSSNQTAHAFYGMLEQKIKGGKNGK